MTHFKLFLESYADASAHLANKVRQILIRHSVHLRVHVRLQTFDHFDALSDRGLELTRRSVALALAVTSIVVVSLGFGFLELSLEVRVRVTRRRGGAVCEQPDRLVHELRGG